MSFEFLLLLLFSFSAHAQTPACLGTSIELNSQTNNPFVDLSFEYSSLHQMRRGWFLIDTGSNISHLDYSAAVTGEHGETPDPTELNFFRKIPFPDFHWNDYSDFDLPVTEMGIIGTNVLSENVYTIDFKNRKFHQSSFDETCTPGELEAAGFLPLSTEGYFTSDENKLFPLEHVVPSDPNPLRRTVPDSPVVPIQVASVPAVAMIDSGFDDRVYTHSVNINLALLNAVNQDGLHLVRARKIPVIHLETCVSDANETVTAYKLQKGDALEWISTSGVPVRSDQDAIFFLKEVPEEAMICGGIGTWEIPAAQVGASFLRDMGTVIFNPETQRVWMPKIH